MKLIKILSTCHVREGTSESESLDEINRGKNKQDNTIQKENKSFNFELMTCQAESRARDQKTLITKLCAEL